MKKNYLKIFQLNVRSYLNNKNSIEYLISKDEYDVYILTETWLKHDSSILTTKYKTIDLFSNDKRGKGIRLIHRSEFIVKQLKEYKS